MRQRLHDATPMIAVFAYLLLGFTQGEWVPGLLIFLLIPLSHLLFADNWTLTIRKLVPFIALAIFLVLTLQYNMAHPGWLVFLLIPIVNTLFFPDESKGSSQ